MDEHARHPINTRPAWGVALALLAGSVFATAAWAQDNPDDPFADSLSVFRETEPIPPTDTTAAPQPTTDPVSTDDEAWVERVARERLGDQRTRLLAEGTFLTARTGTLLTAPSGHRVFVPDKEGRRIGEGPMVVLPSRTLARLDTATALVDEPRVALSGQILVFGGHNLLLPTAYRVVTDKPDEPAASEPTPPAEPAPTPTTNADTGSGSAADDPDVASLFDELDSPDAPRGIEPPRDAPDESEAPLSGRPTPPVVTDAHDRPRGEPEGASIVRRRGRLVRLADGAWAVVFDNDAESGDADSPLTVYPCRTLSRLVPLAQRSGDSLELLVSGRVYAYGSRRYILPTLFQRPAEVGIDPQQ